MRFRPGLWCTVAAVWLAVASGAAAQYWGLPPLPAPSRYGNLLINRTCEKSGKPAVTFSHWSHRMRYTCRVCHLELGFEMAVNTTEITEADNLEGRYCGACHDGKLAFGHTEKHCAECHNGDLAYGAEKFAKLDDFPKTYFGNEIDWVTALKEGLITPRKSLNDPLYEPVSFTKRLDLQAKWNFVPPAVFPHDVHGEWLDCANCHPDIFNVKQRTTAHFEMRYILDAKFCGVCHLRVAFPLNDCRRCHPAMKD